MYVINIKYEDFNGNQQSTDLCFHMSFIDLMKKDSQSDGGSYYKAYQASVNEAFIARDTYRLTGLFTSLICETYGTVIHNGARFAKPANTKAEMQQLPELDEFIQLLVADKTTADAFLKGVLN